MAVVRRDNLNQLRDCYAWLIDVIMAIAAGLPGDNEWSDPRQWKYLTGDEIADLLRGVSAATATNLMVRRSDATPSQMAVELARAATFISRFSVATARLHETGTYSVLAMHGAELLRLLRT